MNSLHQQLVHAYQAEKDLYRRVLELAGEQSRIMKEDPAPSAVLELSQQVQRLLDDIATIEKALEPVKERWERQRQDLDGALKAVLGDIQALIADTSRCQEEVRVALVAYMREREQRAQETRATIVARKAHSAYHLR
jgi:hypothetical protein